MPADRGLSGGSRPSRGQGAPGDDRRARWSRRLWWTAGVAAVFVVLAIVTVPDLLDGILGGGAAPDERLEQDVRDLFADAGPGDRVALSDATGFAWDAVGVFGPYHPHEAIVDEMDVDVPKSVTNWTVYDTHCLLVFRTGDRMTAWTLVERTVAECSGELSGRVHSDDVRFEGDAFAPAD